jgi:hypothetical protein
MRGELGTERTGEDHGESAGDKELPTHQASRDLKPRDLITAQTSRCQPGQQHSRAEAGEDSSAPPVLAPCRPSTRERPGQCPSHVAAL